MCTLCVWHQQHATLAVTHPAEQPPDASCGLNAALANRGLLQHLNAHALRSVAQACEERGYVKVQHL